MIVCNYNTNKWYFKLVKGGKANAKKICKLI